MGSTVGFTNLHTFNNTLLDNNDKNYESMISYCQIKFVKFVCSKYEDSQGPNGDLLKPSYRDVAWGTCWGCRGPVWQRPRCRQYWWVRRYIHGLHQIVLWPTFHATHSIVLSMLTTLNNKNIITITLWNVKFWRSSYDC